MELDNGEPYFTGEYLIATCNPFVSTLVHLHLSYCHGTEMIYFWAQLPSWNINSSLEPNAASFTFICTVLIQGPAYNRPFGMSASLNYTFLCMTGAAMILDVL